MEEIKKHNYWLVSIIHHQIQMKEDMKKMEVSQDALEREEEEEWTYLLEQQICKVLNLCKFSPK